MPDGFLDILNCNAGHMKFSFDKEKPDDVAKARKAITDMLKRGYTLLVETPEGTKRVKRFDPEHDHYIIEEAETGTTTETTATKRTRKLPMRTTKATAVGRTAGG